MWVDPDSYHYLPIVILMAVGAIIGIVLIAANYFLGTRVRENLKQHYDVYECGVPPVGNARQQFSVRYYLVGIVFLLFDVEVVFMYPWAIVYKKFLTQGPFILLQMITFFVILLVGYFYLLGRKGLDWD
ncbi:MAG TPA: NADH-quinone oxidoreductase subunit A [Oligoflexus sp.]|uniref:NADH-quinone oxidoreductase subunit A n=1 Tax=Oligoflexus sp. TaxID=1971216 RepID=UPI002D58F7B8|nr:NADH-quinone oxidoreductase subunit A [Oligoflexus sp.]HYX35719.1 NADH-quinone oxidoreductase subunit A [Oligoflexus sp.]